MIGAHICGTLSAEFVEKDQIWSLKIDEKFEFPWWTPFFLNTPKNMHRRRTSGKSAGEFSQLLANFDDSMTKFQKKIIWSWTWDNLERKSTSANWWGKSPGKAGTRHEFRHKVHWRAFDRWHRHCYFYVEKCHPFNSSLIRLKHSYTFVSGWFPIPMKLDMCHSNFNSGWAFIYMTRPLIWHWISFDLFVKSRTLINSHSLFGSLVQSYLSLIPVFFSIYPFIRYTRRVVPTCPGHPVELKEPPPPSKVASRGKEVEQVGTKIDPAAAVALNNVGLVSHGAGGAAPTPMLAPTMRQSWSPPCPCPIRGKGGRSGDSWPKN